MKPSSIIELDYQERYGRYFSQVLKEGCGAKIAHFEATSHLQAISHFQAASKVLGGSSPVEKGMNAENMIINDCPPKQGSFFPAYLIRAFLNSLKK